MKARSHQARDVGHVHHQIGAHLVRHLAEALKVDGAAVRAGAGDNEFRLRRHRDALQLVVIDISLVVDAVGHDVEIQSGEVHGTSVGQMSAVVQVHAHHCVARL